MLALIGERGAYQLSEKGQSELKFWKSAVSNLVGDNYEQSKNVDFDFLMHFLSLEVQPLN